MFEIFEFRFSIFVSVVAIAILAALFVARAANSEPLGMQVSCGGELCSL